MGQDFGGSSAGSLSGLGERHLTGEDCATQHLDDVWLGHLHIGVHNRGCPLGNSGIQDPDRFDVSRLM